jgi:hypothetical protein
LSKYFLALFFLKISNGNLFYAGINNYPIALSIKYLFIRNIYTFDNGNVNIDPNMPGTYHKNNALSGESFKRKIARKIFPKGCNNYIKKRIVLHFTIFNKYKNITEISKTIPLTINWNNHLINEDKNLTKKNIKKIMLGTVFSERTAQQLKAREKYLGDVDFYIAHPREDINFDSSKIINPLSPVESLIQNWKNKNNLIIYHFNSTVYRLWEDNKNIQFINIDSPGTDPPLRQLDKVIKFQPKIDFKNSQKFLVCSPDVNKILLEKDFLVMQPSHEVNLKFIPKIIALFIYGYLKLVYLFLMQRSLGSLNEIDHIVLESDSKHMYQNYFKVHPKQDNQKYIVLKAYDKNSFTSIQKVPFRLMNAHFIAAISELVQFSKITSTNLFNRAYKNIFKSISIYAYWNALFSYIKQKNASIKVFSSSCQIPDCAASNVNFNSVYLAHGLVDKFYTMPYFNEVWVYSEDERCAYEDFYKHGNTQIYNYQQVYQHSNNVLIVLSALDNEMNLDQLIGICKLMIEKKLSVIAKLHASNKKSKIFIDLQKAIGKEIYLNEDGSVAEALLKTSPYYCIGWTSTGLCESLNMNIIPISLSEKNSPYVDQMVYKIKKRSLFWPEDSRLITNLLSNQDDYQSTISFLLNNE